MIVGLGLLTGMVACQAAPGKSPAHSARQAQPARLAAIQDRPAMRAPESLDADDAFVQARRYAMAEPNADRFELYAERASDVAILEPYIQYWRLRLRLADRRLDGDPALDHAAELFLDKEATTIAGDMLRRDWMLNLGRRGEWARFTGVYSQWVLRDDTQVECYRLLGAASRGEPVGPEARALLLGQASLSDGCNQLLETFAANGLFSRDDLDKLLRGAMEFNSPSSLRRIGALLGLDVDRAINRPVVQLAAGGGGTEDLVAFTRLARQDPSAAAARLDGLRLNAADAAFAWSQLASAGMRRLDPEALDWTRLALRADATDETWAWLARAALRGQDWQTLSAVIARMSAEAQAEPTWVYWRARALQQAGRKDDADALMRTIADQHHFYGQLAGESLGQLTVAPPRASSPTPPEMAAADNNPGFARALKFYELGLRFEGNREWNFQLRTMNDRQLLAAADWACRRQVLDRCVNTADRTLLEHDFALRYVSPFYRELRPLAEEQGLDPAWVYGLIRQESRFVMNARSSAGAQGLMQMMPATARWVARKLGVNRFRVEQLNELDTNLRFGTFYLRTVFDDLDGSPLLASAAYNAGPGRPRSWRATLPASVEGAVFAEIIPFNETRDYVKKVLSNATYYSALFTGRPQSLTERLGSVGPSADTPTDIP
ncbi:MAG: transglycosylase SLT domain-containing protein [Burkholderiaceae bacterium]